MTHLDVPDNCKGCGISSDTLGFIQLSQWKNTLRCPSCGFENQGTVPEIRKLMKRFCPHCYIGTINNTHKYCPYGCGETVPIEEFRKELVQKMEGLADDL